MLRTHKALSLVDAQVKFAKDDSGSVEGYASVFGGVDSYGDTIHKGAYLQTIKENPRPYFNFAHRDDRPMGPIAALSEDDTGLIFRAGFTAESPDAQAIRGHVANGTLTGLSIEFRPYPGGATPKDDNSGGYDLTNIKLRGIAIVAYPADDNARVIDAKSELATVQSIRDFEQWLRDVTACSKSDAVALVARFKSICQGEPDTATAEEITRLKEQLARFEAGAALADVMARSRNLLTDFIK